MQPEEFAQRLRTELPRLLRHELWGIFLEAFPARQEFTTRLEEIRAFPVWDRADVACESFSLVG